VWKLDDIYTFDDEYTRPESLRQWSSQPWQAKQINVGSGGHSLSNTHTYWTN
jgi:hypothetical protein